MRSARFASAVDASAVVRTLVGVARNPKDLRFELRLSVDEREMLRVLAEKAGEGEAVVIRRLIRGAFEVKRRLGAPIHLAAPGTTVESFNAKVDAALAKAKPKTAKKKR